MPTDRILGDLQPRPTLHDARGAVEELDRAIVEETPAAPDAVDAETARARLAGQIEQLERAIAGEVMTAFEQMKRARDGSGRATDFRARWLREEEKYRNEQSPTLDALGQVQPDDPDAHLRTGSNIGAFADNVNTVSAWLSRTVLGRGSRPYILKANGRKQENDLKTLTVLDLLGNLLEGSGFASEVDAGILDLPKHGTCVLRQTWVETAQWTRRPEGGWEERIARRGPSIRHWRLLDVFVSNPKRPWAADQDAVIWYSRTTLSRLAENERVWETALEFRVDAPGGGIRLAPRVARRGRFINLERLRRPEARFAQTAGFEEQGEVGQAPEGTSSEVEGGGQVSAEELMDLYEFQGRFPLGRYIREGKLTAEMLDYYGIDLAVAGEEPDGGAARPSGEKLARLCDGLFWHLAVNDRGMLLEFQPCPYREPRTELVGGFFVSRGQEFYGMSSEALAGNLEDNADQVLNDLVQIIHANGRPAKAVCETAVGDGNEGIEKIATLLNAPDGTVSINDKNLTPDQVIKYFTRPFDGRMVDVLSILREMYDTRTLSSALARGGQAQTESDTLGEAQAQLQAIENRLAQVALRLSETQIVVPIVRNVLRDLDWFMTPEELEDEARRVAGEKGLEWRAIFATAAEEGAGRRARPLAEEFTVTSAANAELQKEVEIQFRLKMDESLRDLPTFNRESNARDMYLAMGLDADRYFVEPAGAMSPRKEFEMILAGDRPQVRPDEIAMQHLAEHQVQMIILRQVRDALAARGEAADATERHLATLEAHILETQDLAQQQALLAMQMAAASAPRGAQGGAQGGNNGGGGRQMKTPPDQARISAGLASAALRTPGQVMQR